MKPYRWMVPALLAVAALSAPRRSEASDTQVSAEDSREGSADRTTRESLADELVTRARQTSAKIRFVEDVSLLEPVGGVGAFLRFKP